MTINETTRSSSKFLIRTQSPLTLPRRLLYFSTRHNELRPDGSRVRVEGLPPSIESPPKKGINHVPVKKAVEMRDKKEIRVEERGPEEDEEEAEEEEEKEGGNVRRSCV